MKPPVYLPALLLCANQGQYFIYLKIDDESLSLFVALVDRAGAFAPELIDEVSTICFGEITLCGRALILKGDQQTRMGGMENLSQRQGPFLW